MKSHKDIYYLFDKLKITEIFIMNTYNMLFKLEQNNYRFHDITIVKYIGVPIEDNKSTYHYDRIVEKNSFVFLEKDVIGYGRSDNIIKIYLKSMYIAYLSVLFINDDKKKKEQTMNNLCVDLDYCLWKSAEDIKRYQ